MKCKFCQAELEDDNMICPACGKDNSEPEEVLEETKSAESVEETKDSGEIILKVTPAKLALAIGICVVLMALLVALVVGGLNSDKKDNGPTELATTGATQPSPTEEITEPATIPADSGKADVTNKGSYTAADDAVIAAADTVIATVGDKTLTNAELQVYYWMYIRQFLSSEMGYYASYIGLDLSKGLDTQTCYYDENLTWQQYFLQEALNSWYSYQAMTLEAEEANYQLDEEMQTYLDGLPATLQEIAANQGFESVDSLMVYYVGPGADLNDYLAYENLYYTGYSYFYGECDKFQPTDAELETFFDAHAEEYASQGLTKETKHVDVRHILILPEGATLETIYSETFSDEAWASGERLANEILDGWKKNGKTEEKFAELANTHSADPGSNANGGLYSDVYQGQMMESFDAWCFDESRKPGDTGIVRTAAGWHVMYYSDGRVVWKEYAKNDLMTDYQDKLMAEIMEKYPVTVDYAKIQLAMIPMA